MAQENEIRDGELSAHEAPGGGHEVFSDDDPFGMPAGYAGPGQDPREKMAEMRRNAAEYDAEQQGAGAGAGAAGGKAVARKTLPIPSHDQNPKKPVPTQHRGPSSQAGLAAIRAGAAYGGSPAPGEPGSRFNPRVVTMEERSARTVVVDHAEQARRRGLPVAEKGADAKAAPQGYVSEAKVATSDLGASARSATAGEALAEGLMEGASAGADGGGVVQAAAQGFVSGASRQLGAQAAASSGISNQPKQPTASQQRRQKMSAWAERIEEAGDQGKDLER